jgi:guanylate kinase
MTSVGDAVRGLQLVIVSSPSGAGKTTLWHMLIEDERRPGIHASVSHTTRVPRPGERDGVDYYFVDDARFEAIRARDGFAEHAEVHGHLYGTSTAEIERIARLEGVRAIVFDIDVQGARQLLSRYPHALSVFILPPDVGELRRRLEGRGTEDPDQLRLRLKNAADEMRCYNRFDYLVVNDDLDEAYAELCTVLDAHRASTAMRRPFAESLLARWAREVEP